MEGSSSSEAAAYFGAPSAYLALCPWSSPSEGIRPIYMPARSHASDCVKERLALVAERREEAEAAWAAWVKTHKPPRRPKSADDVGKKLRGSPLPADTREEWRRQHELQRKILKQLRAGTDQDIKKRELEAARARAERVEARKKRDAEARKKQRAQLAADVALQKRRQRDMSRQLAQLQELDRSPLLTALPKVGAAANLAPKRRGKLKKQTPGAPNAEEEKNKAQPDGGGALPEEEHATSARVRPTSAHQSKLDKVKRREARAMRLEKDALIAEYRRKRDGYLGARVHYTSEGLLKAPGRELPPVEHKAKRKPAAKPPTEAEKRPAAGTATRNTEQPKKTEHPSTSAVPKEQQQLSTPVKEPEQPSTPVKEPEQPSTSSAPKEPEQPSTPAVPKEQEQPSTPAVPEEVEDPSASPPVAVETPTSRAEEVTSPKSKDYDDASFEVASEAPKRDAAADTVKSEPLDEARRDSLNSSPGSDHSIPHDDDEPPLNPEDEALLESDHEDEVGLWSDPEPNEREKQAPSEDDQVEYANDFD